MTLKKTFKICSTIEFLEKKEKNNDGYCYYSFHEKSFEDYKEVLKIIETFKTKKVMDFLNVIPIESNLEYLNHYGFEIKNKIILVHCELSKFLLGYLFVIYENEINKFIDFLIKNKNNETFINALYYEEKKHNENWKKFLLAIKHINNFDSIFYFFTKNRIILRKNGFYHIDEKSIKDLLEQNKYIYNSEKLLNIF